MKAFVYWKCCVGWSMKDLHILEDIIDNGKAIKESTFRRVVNEEEYKELQTSFGYELKRNSQGGLTIKDDWAVGFWSSFSNGERFYYITHSAIEYVFKKETTND